MGGDIKGLLGSCAVWREKRKIEIMDKKIQLEKKNISGGNVHPPPPNFVPNFNTNVSPRNVCSELNVSFRIKKICFEIKMFFPL